MYANEGLGLVAPPKQSFISQAVSTVPVVGGALSAIGSLFGHDSKDPGRLAANARAFNQHAVFYLKGRSGRYGKVQHEFADDAENPVGGWATAKAKDDAFGKFQQLSQPESSVYAQPAPVSAGVAALGLPATVAGLSTGPLLMAGVALAGIAYLSSSRGRR